MLDKLRSRLVHFGPSLMSVPVKLTPFALQRQVLQQVLSWQFRQALADGELEFLEGRWLSITVRDIGLKWYTSVENDKLIVCEDAQADVSFSADASDLLMIAARKPSNAVDVPDGAALIRPTNVCRPDKAFMSPSGTFTTRFHRCRGRSPWMSLKRNIGGKATR